MKSRSAKINVIALIGLILFIVSACTRNADPLTQEQRSAVTDSVQHMAESIAAAVTHDGPIAWLQYFEDSPGFFMANNGQLVFPDHAAAESFINNTLVKSISKIELHWSNLRIDPLTSQFAVIAADYHEDITNTAGSTMPYDGYFTGIAHRTSHGWRLKNANWSVKSP